jgi:cytochrome c55X
MLGLGLGLTVPALAADAPPEPAPARRAELLHLVRQDCGSCHGLTLAGGLGPALTPVALADKPTEYLTNTILDGHPGTPMPPWRPFVSEAEAAWIAAALRRGLPEAP